MSIRDYILESHSKTPQVFRFGSANVKEIDPLPGNVDCMSVFKRIEEIIPSRFIKGLEDIRIENRPEFKERNLSALYHDDVLYIGTNVESANDLVDDIIHEIAHHIETLYTGFIYDDGDVVKEFRKKRKELEFELASEGYWVDKFDFSNINFDEKFDKFLYKRLGRNMLKNVTAGMFVRPYAATSVREYFATGFEAYYLGKKDKLQQISPALYNKIEELHTHQDLS